MGDENKLGRNLALKNLLVASLIADGDKALAKNKNVLEIACNYKTDKIYYLLQYIKQYNLKSYIRIHQKSQSFYITVVENLRPMIEKWYSSGNQKYFFKASCSEDITLQSIIICINLFGYRKVDGIGFKTTVDEKSLYALVHTISNKLNHFVFFSNGNVSIPSVDKLCEKHLSYLTALESTELVNYLTRKEMNSLKMINPLKGRKAYWNGSI